MEKPLSDWNGRSVPAVQSRGGVWAFLDFGDGMIKFAGIPWPSAEIAQKVCRSDKVSAFYPEDVQAVTAKLGFYTDLQSAHSEDAMVWSYFGPISRAQAAERNEWARWFCSLVEVNTPVASSDICLWRRVTHPDSFGSGGPEIDALIVVDEAVIIIEAKWRSSESRWQGIDGRSSQMQLRDKYLCDLGERVFGKRTVALVSLVLEPTGTSSSTKLPVRELTWAELCHCNVHPCGYEILSYYDWKRNLIQRRHGVAAPG